MPHLPHGGPCPGPLRASLAAQAASGETPSGSAQRGLRALRLGAARLGWLRPLPAAGRLLRCVPRAHPVPGHVLCSPPGPSSGFFPFPTLRLEVTPGCRSPEVCGGGGEGENASSPAHGHGDRAPAGTGVRKPLSRVHGTLQNQGTCPLPKPHIDGQAGRNEWTTHRGVLLHEPLATVLPRNKRTRAIHLPRRTWVPGARPARGAGVFVGRGRGNCSGGRV